MDIVIILALILLNGIFAMSEIAIVSSKRIRLQRLAENGSRGAHVALELSEAPSRFLSTIQVGITLIGIFNGAFGEASLVSDLAPRLETVPLIAPYARETALFLVVVGITFASLIFGELVPKRIAMHHPETIATFIARPMNWLSRLMAPFVKVLTGTTEFSLRILGIRNTKEDVADEDEIEGILKESVEAGVFEKTEHEIVTRALRLDDQRIAALMTPRIDVHYIDLDKPVEEILALIAESPYSRFPVCRGDWSEIIGVVHAGSLFAQTLRGNEVEITTAARPPLYVPDSISAMQLLETFKKHREELALVVDEYGELEGIVTLTDVLGALVGDVMSIDDEAAPDAVRREDGSWLVDGGVSIQRFRDLMEDDVQFPEEESGAFNTLAGFVITHLGSIPKVSDHFVWGNYRFEVVDMDRTRIDKLLVTPVYEFDEQE